MTVNTVIGKITASKEALHNISIALSKAADSIQARKGVEERDVYGYDTASYEIFRVLYKDGFYTTK